MTAFKAARTTNSEPGAAKHPAFFRYAISVRIVQMSDAPPPAQLDKFKQAARELECDDDEARFEERLGRLVMHKPVPEKLGDDAYAFAAGAAWGQARVIRPVGRTQGAARPRSERQRLQRGTSTSLAAHAR